MSFTELLLLIFGVLFILGMIVSYIHDWKQDEKLYQEEKKRKNIEAAKLNSVEELKEEVEEMMDRATNLCEYFEYYKSKHEEV